MEAVTYSILRCGIFPEGQGHEPSLFLNFTIVTREGWHVSLIYRLTANQVTQSWFVIGLSTAFRIPTMITQGAESDQLPQEKSCQSARVKKEQSSVRKSLRMNRKIRYEISDPYHSGFQCPTREA